nr:ATP-binding protein [Fodinibius roseus]
MYRVGSEAAKNAAIHGGANNIKIVLNVDDQFLYMTIEDDGMGLEVSEDTEDGMGIHIMRYRIELIGGTFEIKTTPNIGETGTTVTCRIPLKEVEGYIE